MIINNNISALRTNSILSRNNKVLSKHLERLSSGYKINRAADDAAGMAISQKMKTQIRGLEQSSRNGSDGISFIQTAEGALSEVESMLQRIRELCVQAANDTYTDEDRKTIQDEIDNLNDEITRISETTEFNTKILLNGNIDRKTTSSEPKVKVIDMSDGVNISDYKLTVKSDPRQAIFLSDASSNDSSPIKDNEEGEIIINTTVVKINKGDSLEVVYSKIREAGQKEDVTVFPTKDANPTNGTNYETAGYMPTQFGTSTSLVFMSDKLGSSQKVEVQCTNADLATRLGLSTNLVTAVGKDAEVEIDTTTGKGFSSTATTRVDGDKIIITDKSGFELKLQVEHNISGTNFTSDKTINADAQSTPGQDKDSIISILDAGPIVLQLGANEGQDIEVRVPRVDSETLGIKNLNVSIRKKASESIGKANDAINKVSAVRAKLGAYQNRLEHSILNIDETGLNMTEALSRIEDANMALEMSGFTQYNVLVQAGTSMLAQANQRPQHLLTLLQN